MELDNCKPTSERRSADPRNPAGVQVGKNKRVFLCLGISSNEATGGMVQFGAIPNTRGTSWRMALQQVA